MDIYGLTSILVPIAICVVLPVSIVLIVFLTSINKDNKNAQVLIKAIEANSGIDADKLAETLRKPKKTPLELLNTRLLNGCVYAALGLAFLICGLVNFTGDSTFNGILYLAAAVCLAVGAGFLTVYFATRGSVDK